MNKLGKIIKKLYLNSLQANQITPKVTMKVTMLDFIQLTDKNIVLKCIIEVKSIIKAHISEEFLYSYNGLNINEVNVSATINE